MAKASYQDDIFLGADPSQGHTNTESLNLLIKSYLKIDK